MKIIIVISLILISAITYGQSGLCADGVPKYDVFLTDEVKQTYDSEPMENFGTCCGLEAPNTCVKLVIMLHDDAEAIMISELTGNKLKNPVLKLDCERELSFNEIICFDNPGPHRITICGEDAPLMSRFRIKTYPAAKVEATYDVALEDTLIMSVKGFVEPTINWMSISPGDSRQHDYLLDRISSTDTVVFSPNMAVPIDVEYRISGKTVSGCLGDTISVYTVVTTDRGSDILIPNAFTPTTFSGEGLAFIDHSSPYNEVFYPITGDAEYIESYVMRIYNRWGELICVSKDLDYGWDGYYHGEIVQQDVYFYSIDFTYKNGDKLNKIGEVTVLH